LSVIAYRFAHKKTTMPVKLPRHAPGMRIGLFGGSFNPPHEGHFLASITALKRLRLDSIWWIVTPGNPLKDTADLPDQAARMQTARAVARHPAIEITGFEREIGTRYTWDTIDYLTRRCPFVHFVWLMGADNLRQFHRWQNWQKIAHRVPIAVIDRPGSTMSAASSRTAHRWAHRRIDGTDGKLLPRMKPPAWIFLHGPRSEVSSTALRLARLNVT
jgi:nicotinate-nucleotide adenylyltransferase